MVQQKLVSSEKTNKDDGIRQEEPELRFPNFFDSWKVSKLGEISTVSGGKRMPKGSTLIDEQNNHPYITVSNMNTDLTDLNNFQFVPLDIFPQIKNYIVNENDLIISVAGTLGLVKKVPKILDKANLTENANRISKIQINEDYLYFYLNSNLIQNRILSVQTNNAQPKLALKEIRNFKIKYPSNNEQKKIANLFLNIDKKIALLEKEYQTYQDFKKYLMQQIFTQKLRFENLNGELKKYKLKEIFDVKSSNISINSIEDNIGEFPLYGTSGYIKSIDFYEMKQDYISISKDGTVGKIDYHESKSSVINTSQYLIPKEDFNLHFLYYHMQMLNFKKYIVGSTIPHIYFKDYGNEKILMPDLNEQEQIGGLLVNVDKIVDSMKKNIFLMNKYKKGLLQKMFV